MRAFVSAPENVFGDLKSKVHVRQVGKAHVGEQFGCHVVIQSDENYPELLKQIYDPPVVLYVKGSLTVQDKNSVALVGSRMTTPYGMEIARGLMLRPAFLLLDEPAAGLSAEEIRRLGAFLVEVAKTGTGVLLVEHHADLIFDICHQVTVLNLGKKLAAGTPAEIRSHREVVNAYLGG